MEEKEKENLETINVLSNEMEELSLDLPSSNTLSESLVTIGEKLVLPSFMQHPDACDRFCCKWLEYQELIVMHAHLKALISINNNTSNYEIQEYFEGCLHIFKHLQKRFKTTDIFWETHANILLDYGNILLKAKNKKCAETINTKLLSLVANKNFLNIYLYHYAQVQKMVLLTNNIPSVEEVLVVEEETSPTFGSPPKTPETKFSEAKIIEQPTSSSNLPFFPPCHKKKLNFNAIKESVSGNARTPVKTPVMVPATIDVHPSEAGTTRKKRTTVTKNLLGEGCTPCDSAKSNKLRSKTELLTQKIKNESNIKARKNLMGELASSNSEVKTEKEVTKKVVATRKSKRNIKI